MPLSTKVLTHPRSFTCIISILLVVLVKVESGLDPIINLLDSCNDDRCVMLVVNPSPQAPSTSPVPFPSDLRIPSSAVPKSSVKQPRSIVDSLHRLVNMSSSKNILKKLDYDSL